MSRQALPLLYLNMAGEMCYILNCRFRTKNLTVLEENIIMSDITFALFDKDFVRALFDPRDQFSETMLRNLFEKVHEGLLTREPYLDEERLWKDHGKNMEDLYELMTAMVKCHLNECDEPEKILTMTRRHMDWICGCLVLNLGERLQVDYAFNLFWQTFSGMNRFELNLVRQTAINFLQGCHLDADVLVENGLRGLDSRYLAPLLRMVKKQSAPINRKMGRVEADASLFASAGVHEITEEDDESKKSIGGSVQTDRRPENSENVQQESADGLEVELEFKDNDESEQSATGGEAIGVPVEYVSKHEQKWNRALIKPDDDDMRICGFGWIRSRFFK